MSRVAFVNSNIAWGGGEKWHLNAAKEMKSRGHQVVLICFPQSKIHLKAKEEGIETIGFEINNISFINPIKKYRFNKILKELDIDSIILNLPQDVKFVSPIASRLNVKNIIYRRGTNHPIKSNFINKKIYTQFITKIIANSEEVKKSIFKNIPQLEKKIEVLYNGVDTSDLADAPSFKPCSPIVLGNLGRLVEQKGQLHLISLAIELNKMKIDYKILIGGTGPLEEELKGLIQKNSLQEKVILNGHMDTEDFFSRIDIFVFSSLWEGLSNALLEALQHFKPTIAFDTSSNSEIIKDAYNGYIISPFDIKEMALKIEQLINNHQIADTYINNGIKVLKKKFDINKKYNQLEKLIHE